MFTFRGRSLGVNGPSPSMCAHAHTHTRTHARTHTPVNDVPLGSVDDLRGAVARAPVDAHRLGLLGLPRRIVGRHPTEPRVVHPVRSLQVPADVRLLVHEAAAHGPGQVSVVVQVAWNTQSLNYTARYNEPRSITRGQTSEIKHITVKRICPNSEFRVSYPEWAMIGSIYPEWAMIGGILPRVSDDR